MNTSCHWLADYLSPVPPVDQAGDLLTMGGYPVEEFSQHKDDDVMDVEVTSNRPDLLCHLGVARELAALSGGTFKHDEAEPADNGQPATDAAGVRIDDKDLCPHYTARVIKDVKIGPSPQWMQDRLEAIGLRPINNVVDVTNYVLMEYGQPLHAFDYDKLRGEAKKHIIVRPATGGEVLKTLDGVDRKLDPSMLVIADESQAVALAGVMGGEATEVSAGTVNVLLESARFDPLSVRNTSRRLKLMSDSSYRFERGLDPTLAVRASARAAQLILDTAGGQLMTGHAEDGEEGFEAQKLRVRWATLKRLLGVELPREDVVAAYAKLGLQPAADDEGVECTVPSHRLDLNIEADLVEEAVRVVGYDKIPESDEIHIRVQPKQPEQSAMDVIRDQLVGAGYFESITFSFVSDKLQSHFLPEGANLRRVDPNVRKADGHLRPSILPGLIESLRTNESVGNGSVHLFETGSIFYKQDGSAVEQRHLAFVGGEDYHHARGVLETLLAKLDTDRPVTVKPAAATGFGEGACGEVVWGEESIGHIGMLDRGIVDATGLRHQPAVCEISLDALLAGHVAVPENKPLSRFPAVSRDVSLVVDEAVRYAELAGLVDDLGLDHLETVAHAATYRGKPLAEGQKSVTLTLSFRSNEGTLTREQADEAMGKVLDTAKQKYSADVRA